MILAAGLTPAWQQIVVLDELCVGEVNRAREVHWCASGKVLNVGLALHNLGAQSNTLALVGGPARDAIETEFSVCGVPHRWIGSQSPTRVCTTILDTGAGVTTELVENAQPVTAADLAAFSTAYVELAVRADVVVLTGSLPAGTPATFYRELLAQTPGRVVLDARGESLLAALEMKPFVVKPNREELGQTLGRVPTTEAELVEAMHEINRRGAEWVVVSQGEDVLWVSSAERVFRAQPPHVEVVNPIGSGDCLAAGIAWALEAGRPMPDAVRYGMAAAAENVRQLLPARLDRSRVKNLAAEIRVQSYE